MALPTDIDKELADYFGPAILLAEKPETPVSGTAKQTLDKAEERVLPLPDKMKEKPIRVFSNQQFNILSDTAIDCRGVNALNIQIFVRGTNPSATITIKGASEAGANYLALADLSAVKTAVAASVSYDVIVGTAWAKVDLSAISGTFASGEGYTIIVTPYISAGPSVIEIVDASGNVLNVSAANTARTTGTLVLPTQLIDATGAVNAVVGKAGEAHLGEVGGAGVRLTDSLTRPANATAYTAKDVLAAATVAVTGTASGTGGVVRLTVASHPLQTGQAVTVASIGGTTEANGDWIVTNVNATHIELIGSTYANAWTSGGTIQPMITLLSAGRKVGGSIWLDQFVRETTDMADVVAHKLWFYTSQPTQLADNAVFTLLTANKAKRAGAIILDAQATEASGSDITYAQNIVDKLHIICAAADTRLFVVDEVLTGFTPTTGAVVTYYVNASQD